MGSRRGRRSTVAGALLWVILMGPWAAAQSHETDPKPELPAVTRDQVAEAVRRGRMWLLKHQNADGSWSGKVGYKLNDNYMGREEHPHVGFTALAGLALMEPGELGMEDQRRRAVAVAATWLMEVEGRGRYGYIAAHGTRFIEHAYATQFLAELQLRRPDPAVEVLLWRASGLIVRSQNEEGGWRYQPFARDADLPFTVPPLEALLAAVRVGIEVPKETLERGLEYVRRCGNKNVRDGSFSYQDLAPHQTRFTFPCTAVGVFALGEMGRSDAPECLRGLEFLGGRYRDMRFGDYHYGFAHYYGSRAARRSYPEWWKAYAAYLRAELIRHQKPGDSWEDDCGEVFATAMACLILEACAGTW